MSRRIAVALAVAASLGVAACSSSAATSAGTTPSPSSSAAPAVPTVAPATAVAPASVAPSATAPYYVSLGDSYAAGYQAGLGTTRDGFAYQVADQAQATTTPLQLVNFACAGATTTSILQNAGCPPAALGPDAAPYDGQTQIEAAEAFLKSHPGEVGLITVSIGGNDIAPCGGGGPDSASCVTQAVAGVSTNLTTLLARLRAAAGPAVPIVGTTYPDVLLGVWVSGTPEGQQLANLSITAFRSLLNPALQKAYEGAGGQLVDVTEATGAYGPMTDTTDVAPYGAIPVPVAQVCELTTFCSKQDIHPTPEGYRIIADLVFQAFLASRPSQ